MQETKPIVSFDFDIIAFVFLPFKYSYKEIHHNVRSISTFYLSNNIITLSSTTKNVIHNSYPQTLALHNHSYAAAHSTRSASHYAIVVEMRRSLRHCGA